MKYFIKIIPRFILKWYYEHKLKNIRKFCSTQDFPVSAYLAGSFAFDDYIYGESDIDIIFVVRNSKDADQLYKNLFYFIPQHSKIIQFQEIGQSILSLDKDIEKFIGAKKEFYQIQKGYVKELHQDIVIKDTLKELKPETNYYKIGKIDYYRAIAEQLLSLYLNNKSSQFKRKINRLKSLNFKYIDNLQLEQIIQTIGNACCNEIDLSASINESPCLISRKHNFLGPLIWDLKKDNNAFTKNLTSLKNIKNVLQLTDHKRIIHFDLNLFSLYIGKKNFFILFNQEKLDKDFFYPLRYQASKAYFQHFKKMESEIPDYYQLSFIDDLNLFTQETSELFHLKQELQNSNLNISICICTKNRATLLEKLLNQIIYQSFLPFEINIIDNMSTDQTKNICQVFKSQIKLNYFESNHDTISKLRDYAISVSQGDIITFIDDDCEVPKDWLAQIKNIFQKDSQIGLVGGVVRHLDQEDLGIINTFHREYLGAKK